MLAASVAGAADSTTPPAKPAVDLRLHPTGGRTAITVHTGLFITNIVAVDETRESFEVGGYLIARWKDPRLVLAAGQGAPQGSESTRTFKSDELWSPPIEAANTISHKTAQYSLTVDNEGMVTYVERFDAVFSNYFAMRKFPFDSQVLRFEFQPFLSSAHEFVFAPEALPISGLSPTQHSELAAWRMGALRYSIEKPSRPDLVDHSGDALFEVAIQRRSGFYVWKIMLPLLMMTMIPVVVFWLDPKEFDWILKVPLTMLLSMVAFQFSVVRDLPKVEYVTFLDAMFLASFLFCFIAIIEITTVYLIQRGHRRNLAVVVHAAGRWAYPLAYFLLILLVAVFLLL
ncbi:MAG TPA: hypothetical protein VE779_05900 [Candidatus Angelobacter sp.]|nr:hypothetical protein [Candidatus Angelobacter sp.]